MTYKQFDCEATVGDLHEKYIAFTRALTSGNATALSNLVDKSRFRAVLPGGPQQGLDFTMFVPEMERRRAPFSDFGQNVQVHRIIEGDATIAAYYSMTVTHDGELVAWSAAGNISPSGRQITFTSMDMVSFDGEGRITELIVVSDRLPTLLQMGGGV